VVGCIEHVSCFQSRLRNILSLPQPIGLCAAYEESIAALEFNSSSCHVLGKNNVVVEDWTTTTHDMAKTKMAWVADCQ